MLTLSTWFAFVALCTAMVRSPGPNTMYLVSRSISQGSRAQIQRWIMGTVLGRLALRMAIEVRR